MAMILKETFIGSGYGNASHDAVQIKRWICHWNGTAVVA